MNQIQVVLQFLLKMKFKIQLSLHAAEIGRLQGVSINK